MDEDTWFGGLLMGKQKFVAYVSTYTMKDKHGIKIYDVDMDDGRFYEKDEVEITNSSYITLSHNYKFLYSITDQGVEAFKILPDGGLEFINRGSINGMRGCFLSTDFTDKYLFVGGYHDGKVTVLRLREDGGVGEITDEVFHKGLGSVAERNFRPHVNCVKMTKDNRYLCAADLGMDHTTIYKLDHVTGKIRQVDVVRSEIESAPRHLAFSKDGRFMYVVHELKNCVDVYSYREEEDEPYFEKIQSISTMDGDDSGVAASALRFTKDYRYLLSSNAGDNSVVLYDMDKETGKLEMILCLPVSGHYPKDAAMFPDNKHLVSLNHESNTLTFFNVNIEEKTIVMNGRELEVEKPNCVVFHKISE